MDLLKCDKCRNRNIMCCVCEKNKQYRETDFSHDVYIRNKAIDDFADKLKQDVESNPAWASLSAVQNDRYIILPKEIYMLKANLRYAEAYENLAEILYPKLFQ